MLWEKFTDNSYQNGTFDHFDNVRVIDGIAKIQEYEVVHGAILHI